MEDIKTQRLEGLSITFAREKISSASKREVPANASARIQNTKGMANARARVLHPNGLVMVIATIKITCADATGMAGIAAAKIETFSTAHTARAEIQSIKVRTSIDPVLR